MIYLASPYSHPDPRVREQRYFTVCFAAAKMMAAGHHIFSPIAHTHGICEQGTYLGLAYPYEFWKKFDEEMLRLCSELWVLRMDGWEESVGIKAEIVYAASIGKSFKYV